MAAHSSATTRESHVNQTTRTAPIANALKRRAQAVLNDKSIDAQSRAIIRYALEMHITRSVQNIPRGVQNITLDGLPQKSCGALG